MAADLTALSAEVSRQISYESNRNNSNSSSGSGNGSGNGSSSGSATACPPPVELLVPSPDHAITPSPLAVMLTSVYQRAMSVVPPSCLRGLSVQLPNVRAYVL